MTILSELEQSGHWVGSRRQDKDERRTAVRVGERAGKVERRRLDELRAHALDDEVLHGGNHLVWTQSSKYYEPIEAGELVVR